MERGGTDWLMNRPMFIQNKKNSRRGTDCSSPLFCGWCWTPHLGPKPPPGHGLWWHWDSGSHGQYSQISGFGHTCRIPRCGWITPFSLCCENTPTLTCYPEHVLYCCLGCSSHSARINLWGCILSALLLCLVLNTIICGCYLWFLCCTFKCCLWHVNTQKKALGPHKYIRMWLILHLLMKWIHWWA